MGAASLSGMGAEASAWGAALGPRAGLRPRPRACRPPGVPRGWAGARRAEMESRAGGATPPCFKRTPQLRGPARRPDAGKLRGQRWGGGRPAAGRPERVSARQVLRRAGRGSRASPGASAPGFPPDSPRAKRKRLPDEPFPGARVPLSRSPRTEGRPDPPAQRRGAGAWGPHARFSEPAR